MQSTVHWLAEFSGLSVRWVHHGKLTLHGLALTFCCSVLVLWVRNTICGGKATTIYVLGALPLAQLWYWPLALKQRFQLHAHASILTCPLFYQTYLYRRKWWFVYPHCRIMHYRLTIICHIDPSHNHPCWWLSLSVFTLDWCSTSESRNVRPDITTVQCYELAKKAFLIYDRNSLLKACWLMASLNHITFCTPP